MPKQVVLLPGICGTELGGLDFLGRGVLVWLNPTRLLVLGPGDLQLAPDGINPGPLASGPLAPRGYIRIGFYEPLERQLAADGWTVKTVGFDWRKSIMQQGPLAAQSIRQAFPDGDFSVVAHSMGGLIARAAYAADADPAFRARWKRTVYLGTPHGGSHSAAASLCSLEWVGSPILLVAQAFGLFRNLVPILPGGKGRVLDQVKQVIASWPGLYELLPALLGPWVDADPQGGALFDQARYAAWNPYVTQARLDAARATINTLTQQIGGPAPEQLCIVGTGPETPDKVADPAQLGDDAGYSFTTGGDGVVTKLRGVLPPAHLMEYRGGHQGYMQDRVPLGAMDTWLTAPLDPLPSKLDALPQPAPVIVGAGKAPVRPAPAWGVLQRHGDP